MKSRLITEMTAETEVEELGIELDDLGHEASSCEIEVEIDAQPEEKATWDEPGCPASAEVYNFTVTKVQVTDSNGDEVYWHQPHACLIVKKALEKRGWMADQDDWALDTIAEKQQGLEDEYWQHKLDLSRGK